MCALLASLAGGMEDAGADGAVVAPACADLEEWAESLEPVEKWSPVEGSRAWIPKSFAEPSFAELFGAPPLDWDGGDPLAMGKRMFTCAGEAADAGRQQARRALLGARRYVQSNLMAVLTAHDRAAAAKAREAERGAARQRREAERRSAREARRAQLEQAEAARRAEREQAQARQESALQEALDGVLSQPDSLRLLVALTAIREINPRDALAVNTAIGRYGRAAGTLLGTARSQGLKMSDPRIAGPIDERVASLRERIGADYRQRIAGLSNNADGLMYLDRIAAEVDAEIAPALGPEAAGALQDAVTGRRADIQRHIVQSLRERIDAIAKNPGDPRTALGRIGAAASGPAMSRLTPQQARGIRDYARERQASMADRVLAAEQNDLADVPGTLDGVQSLLGTLYSTRSGSLAGASDAAKRAYRQAAGPRLSEVAESALPEFRAGIAAFPETPQALAMLDRTMPFDDRFKLVDDAIRQRYMDAVASRQSEIRAAIQERHEADRQRALAAGGDPDLVGARFTEPESGLSLEFLDERRVRLYLSGKTDTAPYALKDQDILVRGPGMALRFTRSGTGADTRLQWLGKVLRREAD